MAQGEKLIGHFHFPPSVPKLGKENRRYRWNLVVISLTPLTQEIKFFQRQKGGNSSKRPSDLSCTFLESYHTAELRDQSWLSPHSYCYCRKRFHQFEHLRGYSSGVLVNRAKFGPKQIDEAMSSNQSHPQATHRFHFGFWIGYGSLVSIPLIYMFVLISHKMNFTNSENQHLTIFAVVTFEWVYLQDLCPNLFSDFASSRKPLFPTSETD